MQGGRMEQGTSTQPRTLEDDLTEGMRITLYDATEAANTSEWCADECISEGSPEMSECIRLCRDVADLASLTARFISRGSLFGPDIAETFAVAAEECARECSRHSHAHCQETAYVLQRAADSTWALLDEMAGQQVEQQHVASGSL
ncbi:four-helix bundle copper-binding protein [Halobacterium zhouii]|uniref:four-helix bundle copper-binding protein n=1 Tax=Halobacterium zhouii TaxID=2902624 RepID=UPI001E319D6A|nr:four-helix bundle copper-binding protein [Halobacterium zhouii]